MGIAESNMDMKFKKFGPLVDNPALTFVEFGEQQMRPRLSKHTEDLLLVYSKQHKLQKANINEILIHALKFGVTTRGKNWNTVIL